LSFRRIPIKDADGHRIRFTQIQFAIRWEKTRTGGNWNVSS
jgi:hypothetical protein